jgi:hypothetical protein
MEVILIVVAAAGLYLVALPLFGLVVGIMIRIVLPYGAGVFLLYLLASYACAISQVLTYTIGASILWVAFMLRTRTKLQVHRGQLAWYEGHYTSALNVLTLSRFIR